METSGLRKTSLRLVASSPFPTGDAKREAFTTAVRAAADVDSDSAATITGGFLGGLMASLQAQERSTGEDLIRTPILGAATEPGGVDYSAWTSSFAVAFTDAASDGLLLRLDRLALAHDALYATGSEGEDVLWADDYIWGLLHSLQVAAEHQTASPIRLLVSVLSSLSWKLRMLYPDDTVYRSIVDDILLGMQWSSRQIQSWIPLVPAYPDRKASVPWKQGRSWQRQIAFRLAEVAVAASPEGQSCCPLLVLQASPRLPAQLRKHYRKAVLAVAATAISRQICIASTLVLVKQAPDLMSKLAGRKALEVGTACWDVSTLPEVSSVSAAIVDHALAACISAWVGKPMGRLLKRLSKALCKDGLAYLSSEGWDSALSYLVCRTRAIGLG